MERDGYAGKPWDAYYHYIDPFIREAGYFVPERIPRIWEYPSLDPWIYEKTAVKEHYVLKRNPYFYMFDQTGERLPYLERLTRDVYSSREELNQALEEDKYDLSGCFLKVNEPLLEKENIKRKFRKIMLRPWQVQQVVFLINLCPGQEWLRPYVQDIRFRRALSLALDREKMRTPCSGERGNLPRSPRRPTAPTIGKALLYETGNMTRLWRGSFWMKWESVIRRRGTASGSFRMGGLLNLKWFIIW